MYRGRLTGKFGAGRVSRGRGPLPPDPITPSPRLGEALDDCDALLSEWGHETSDGAAQPARQAPGPSAAHRLRYHLDALIYSPREPYTWIRSICAYTLLCVAVLALGWLLASAAS